MHLAVLLWLFLRSSSAEIITKLSAHYNDVLKIKCDALPYRTVYADRSCYFVIDSERDVIATAKQCSRIFPGSQFARPSMIPEKVWESLFVDETSFLSSSASRGKTKAMCAYDSQLPPASTVSPTPTSNAGGKAICFRKQISTSTDPIDRPKVIDEYHCKMICAERNEASDEQYSNFNAYITSVSAQLQCLSYIYAGRQCSLFGAKRATAIIGTVCGASARSSGCEWTKKTALADCPDDLPQPFIDFYGYTPNPAILAGGGTQISPHNFTFNAKRACIQRAIMDNILPDNSHKVEGSCYSGLRWNAKLGSWVLQKNDQYGREMPALSYYIRSARCWDVSPLRFKDTTSCGGGTLPRREISTRRMNEGYTFSGVVRRIGMNHVCLYPEAMIFWLENNPTSDYLYNVDGFYVTCIGGTWMWHHQWPNPLHASTSNMLGGVCAKKK